ncbi:unnamed protein product [Soboliphyme baturini]|uniref:AAA_12 domain-containing protein n=1 Tax=Soboliphyme baturini TaxID=241478 RepID=A0A183J8Z0_9BILA|nr:unnamed protein product [Soboliphyme baturini]
MDRLMKQFDPSNFVKLLTLQYRMHETIMNWSSNAFYDGKLVAYKSNRQHLLSDLPDVLDYPELDAPMWFINTADCDMCETESGEDSSKANAGAYFFHIIKDIHALHFFSAYAF